MLCRSRSLVLLLLSAVAALAQFRQDPINSAIQNYYRLRNEGRHDEAALKREEIRALVDRVPVDAPQFVSWFQSVTQMYEQAGKTVEVRAMAQAALARSNRLPETDPNRSMLLGVLANSWQSEGDLLKAVATWEQIATPEAAPAQPYARARLANPGYAGQTLASLYRQLGRPQDAAAALAKAEARLRDNPSALASLYEQEGQIDKAEAQYQQIADQARNPQDAINALQMLANLDQRDGRPEDAVAAQQRALAVAQNSGDPQQPSRTFWMRQSLATFLLQAGQRQQAEQIYQQARSDPQADPLQTVNNYAGFLRSTDRGAQAEKLLSGYLDGHPDLDPGQQANLLYNLAGMVSDPQRAEEYRQAAAQKSPNVPSFPPNSIQEMTMAAQKAGNEGRLDEAFFLCLRAIDIAPQAPDRDSIGNWTITSVAGMIIAQKQPARAGEIYRRLLAVTEGWTADTVQPQAQASRAYIEFLMSRPDRRDAVPALIEQYASLVTAARGADAGAREALDLSINFERSRGAWGRAIFLAQERLRLEESLTGTTSQPYSNSLSLLANLYQASGDSGRALPLHRQMVKIADLTAGPNDPQPAHARMNAAVAFAGERQFEEAERLAAEAMAIEKALHHPTDNFAWQLDQIRGMQKAAAQ